MLTYADVCCRGAYADVYCRGAARIPPPQVEWEWILQNNLFYWYKSTNTDAQDLKTEQPVEGSPTYN
jgi:hypothetical protein